MAPTRLGDGTNIDSIRLGDGTEIAEVRTGAGDVVFSKGLLLDFEDGSLSEWQNDTSAGGGHSITSTAFNGSNALDVRVTTGGEGSYSHYTDATQDIPQNGFFMSAYIRETTIDTPGKNSFFIMESGQVPFNTTDVLYCGLNDATGDYGNQFDIYTEHIKAGEDGPILASTNSTNFSRGTWYFLEFEGDSSGNLEARWYDSSDNLLETLTANYTYPTEFSNAVFGICHAAQDSDTHSTIVDDVFLKL